MGTDREDTVVQEEDMDMEVASWAPVEEVSMTQLGVLMVHPT